MKLKILRNDLGCKEEFPLTKMETTLSVLLASHRLRSDTANNQSAAAARMRGRPILACPPFLAC